MPDWDEESDNESQATNPPQAKVAPAAVLPKKKWEGEDDEGSGPASDWENSESEEEEKSAPIVAPPSKKKVSLKQKLAEKEAAKKVEEDVYDSDDVLDPREKARLDKERELNADLNNAADLLGAAALGGTSSSELDALLSFQPRTKEDFEKLSSQIIEFIISRHQNKPLYAAFVEHHVRQLALPLKDVDVRKAASKLTTLANEKQKEEKDKSSGKKKSKGTAKPALGSAKATNKLDTSAYGGGYDDFGDNPGDFM